MTSEHALLQDRLLEQTQTFLATALLLGGQWPPAIANKAGRCS